MGNKIAHSLAHPEKESSLKQVFKSIDADGNGFLNKHEFNEVAAILFAQPEKFNLDISDYANCCSISDFASRIFALIDTNDDGKLSFEEFLVFFQEKAKSGLDIGLRATVYNADTLRESGLLPSLHERDRIVIGPDAHHNVLFAGFGWTSNGVIELTATLIDATGEKEYKPPVIDNVNHTFGHGVKYGSGSYVSRTTKKSKDDKGFKIHLDELDKKFTHIFFSIHVTNQRQQASISAVHSRIEVVKESKDYGRYFLDTVHKDCHSFVLSALSRVPGDDDTWEFRAIGLKLHHLKLHDPKKLLELFDGCVQGQKS